MQNIDYIFLVRQGSCLDTVLKGQFIRQITVCIIEIITVITKTVFVLTRSTVLLSFRNFETSALHWKQLVSTAASHRQINNDTWVGTLQFN